MSRAPVVADTTPLITRTGVGQLDLLPRLYGAVSIPQQVLREFNAGATSTDPQLETLARAYGWQEHSLSCFVRSSLA